MKKRVKDLTKRQIFEAIYCDEKTSVCNDNCRFCKYCNKSFCQVYCNSEWETCIDYQQIIKEVGDEEIEVEENENR